MRVLTYVFNRADAHRAVKQRERLYAKYLKEGEWKQGEAGFVLRERQWCEYEIATTMVEQRGHKCVEIREVKYSADEGRSTWEVTALVR